MASAKEFELTCANDIGKAVELTTTIKAFKELQKFASGVHDMATADYAKKVISGIGRALYEHGVEMRKKYERMVNGENIEANTDNGGSDVTALREKVKNLREVMNENINEFTAEKLKFAEREEKYKRIIGMVKERHDFFEQSESVRVGCVNPLAEVFAEIEKLEDE